eukprot:GHVL01014560.1.p1 GENE.GHVL01014560.1~~GHVL01014560.1.p1  ORF type:complete len:129 (-),score=5.60 GHVL01014560.1:1065-1451(-)
MAEVNTSDFIFIGYFLTSCKGAFHWLTVVTELFIVGVYTVLSILYTLGVRVVFAKEVLQKLFQYRWKIANSFATWDVPMHACTQHEQNVKEYACCCRCQSSVVVRSALQDICLCEKKQLLQKLVTETE